ncbi:MAG: hypothetical protein LJE62_02875 [Silicimonas sp.]|nr:hypothetical protein [Silicimonas sp.]
MRDLSLFNLAIDSKLRGCDLVRLKVVDLVAELYGHESLDRYRKPHLAAWAGLQYALFRTGPVASNVVEGGLFWHSGDDHEVSDRQYHFLAGASAEYGVGGVRPGCSGITLNCYGHRPEARGTVRLSSANPDRSPLIDPNFMGHPDDPETTVRGLKISREIMSQPALAKYVRRVVLPDDSLRTDAELREFVTNHCRTSYHPVGTCRMGSDNRSVVDTRLRVRGFEGLRICDSSVFPSLMGSNTNAPAAMLAEKASDLIAGDAASL